MEAEILLLGIWKNIQDLEESLSLPELQAMLDAKRDAEHRHNKFLAALKGIDLDEGSTDSAKEKFDEIQQRVNTKLYGEGNVIKNEMDFFGLEIEVEE